MKRLRHLLLLTGEQHQVRAEYTDRKGRVHPAQYVPVKYSPLLDLGKYRIPQVIELRKERGVGRPPKKLKLEKAA